MTDPSEPVRIAVLLTGHFYDQKRRGSLHWLADELMRQGWQVRFVTVGYSWLSLLLGDRRLRALDRAPPVGARRLGERLEAFFVYTPLHPVSLRRAWADRLARPLFGLFALFWRGPLKRLLAGADLVVIESGPPVMLAKTVRRLSRAKLVYRVNDDIRLLRMPPIVIDAEAAVAPLFDRISLASPVLAQRFAATGRTAIDPMGVQKALFDAVHPDPFGARWEREVVCAGTTQFDMESLTALAALRPAWRFTIIGRLATPPPAAANINWLGEIPFNAVVPYVQHADIGFAPYRPTPGVEYQTHHSNRILQYTYVRLPVLAPQAMAHGDVPHLVGYDLASPLGLESALQAVAAIDRATITQTPPGWDVLATRIASVVTGP